MGFRGGGGLKNVGTGLFKKLGIEKLLRKIARKKDDIAYKFKQKKVNKLLNDPAATKHVGTGARRRAKNKFPDQGGPPNGTLYRTNANGDITYYAKYDAQGRMVKRVDFDRGSAPHAGVAPPHTVDYTWHTGPNGRSSKSHGPTRPWDGRQDL